MRVVVLGASGFLGRSIGDALLAAGHDVVGVSRIGAASARLAAEGSVVRADVVAADDTRLEALFHGADAAVYCLGPDDRAPLPAPVPASLTRLLVEPTARAARAARRKGLRHFVVLGSYFATFDRLHPEWRLSARHPYVRARVDQAAGAVDASGGTASVLEIPFVFGAVPGVEPMWKRMLFDPLRRLPVGVTLPGGSAAVTHDDVAGAVLGILSGAAAPGRHPLVVDNVSYRRVCRVVLEELGRRVPVVALPAPVVTTGAVALGLTYRLRGQGTGLDPRYVAPDLLGRDLHLDPTRSDVGLGLVPGSVDEAIRATVRAAYPG